MSKQTIDAPPEVDPKQLKQERDEAKERQKDRLRGLSHAEYLARFGPLVITRTYEKPASIKWDEASYQGDAYGWGIRKALISSQIVGRMSAPPARHCAATQALFVHSRKAKLGARYSL